MVKQLEVFARNPKVYLQKNLLFSNCLDWADSVGKCRGPSDNEKHNVMAWTPFGERIV